MFENKRILVFAPHNDDEVLGVGGTIALLAEKNEVFVCEATTSKVPAAMERIRREAKAADEVMGVKERFFLDLPVVGIRNEGTRMVSEKFNEIVAWIKPHVAFIPHEGDIHTDHYETAAAAMVALRPLPNPQLTAVYAYETLSETEWNTPNVKNVFMPNVWVDITASIETKKAAMACYASQLKDYPHPRSLKAIEALAMYRGSTVGVEYAESFMLLRGRLN